MVPIQAQAALSPIAKGAKIIHEASKNVTLMGIHWGTTRWNSCFSARLQCGSHTSSNGRVVHSKEMLSASHIRGECAHVCMCMCAWLGADVVCVCVLSHARVAKQCTTTTGGCQVLHFHVPRNWPSEKLQSKEYAFLLQLSGQLVLEPVIWQATELHFAALRALPSPMLDWLFRTTHQGDIGRAPQMQKFGS